MQRFTMITGRLAAMLVFKSETFSRFARRERIADSSLLAAIERAERGLLDADLGGGVIKQRVARSGGGWSGGYRTLIAFRSGDFAVFMFGFANSERQNVSGDELGALQIIAGQWLDDPRKIGRDVSAGILIEVEHEDRS